MLAKEDARPAWGPGGTRSTSPTVAKLSGMGVRVHMRPSRARWPFWHAISAAVDSCPGQATPTNSALMRAPAAALRAAMPDLRRRLAPNPPTTPSRSTAQTRVQGVDPTVVSPGAISIRTYRRPDRRLDAMLPACPQCHAAFPETSQTPQQVCERIELPPIKPHDFAPEPPRPPMDTIRLHGTVHIIAL
jgi:hypothetical protein